MKTFHVGRVAIVSNLNGDNVELYSNGHQFYGGMPRGMAVDWAIASFPNALITLLDMTGQNPQVLVIQEAS